jgi:hypothetical protein
MMEDEHIKKPSAKGDKDDDMDIEGQAQEDLAALQPTANNKQRSLQDEAVMIRERAVALRYERYKARRKTKKPSAKNENNEMSEPGTRLPLDTDDHKVEPATTQTSLPEEGTLLREQSFSRFFGRVSRNRERRKTESSETTALSTEAGRVREAPHSSTLRGIAPNQTLDDEVSSEDSSMKPGAVRISGVNGTVDEDGQSTFLETTSTAAPPELVEAELAPDLDEAIALGIQQTVQATAVPVPREPRKPWRILCCIACVFILALISAMTAILISSTDSTEAPLMPPARPPPEKCNWSSVEDSSDDAVDESNWGAGEDSNRGHIGNYNWSSIEDISVDAADESNWGAVEDSNWGPIGNYIWGSIEDSSVDAVDKSTRSAVDGSNESPIRNSSWGAIADSN